MIAATAICSCSLWAQHASAACWSRQSCSALAQHSLRAAADDSQPAQGSGMAIPKARRRINARTNERIDSIIRLSVIRVKAQIGATESFDRVLTRR